VLEPVVNVSVEELPAVTELGTNDAVVAVGRPLADRDTDSAVPVSTAVDTVDVTEPPGPVEPDAGDTAMEKSLATATASVHRAYAVASAERLSTVVEILLG
jgi:hypothetical protein